MEMKRELSGWHFLLARRHLLAGLRGHHFSETEEQQARQLRGALLGAPVPARPLFRQNDQNVRTCALVRHAFVSLGPKQLFVSRQHSGHVLVLTSGPDVLEKEKKLDSRCIASLGHRLRSYGATANRKSNLPGDTTLAFTLWCAV